jgi:methylated-DNA-[protein]-cysteine S-methyltransferase
MRRPITTRWTAIESPLGLLSVARDDVGVTALLLPRGSIAVTADWTRDDEGFADVRTQLDEYFAGHRTDFDLPLHPSGTPFQQRVWAALRTIPYGETASYGEVAAAIGNPSAFRAVGAANGQNPISIVVPCHRVIGSHGALTGYGGGLDAKRWLLSHEAAHTGIFAS